MRSTILVSYGALDVILRSIMITSYDFRIYMKTQVNIAGYCLGVFVYFDKSCMLKSEGMSFLCCVSLVNDLVPFSGY